MYQNTMHIYALSIVVRVQARTVFFSLFASRCASKLHAVSTLSKDFPTLKDQHVDWWQVQKAQVHATVSSPKNPAFALGNMMQCVRASITFGSSQFVHELWYMKHKDSLFNIALPIEGVHLIISDLKNSSNGKKCVSNGFTPWKTLDESFNGA